MKRLTALLLYLSFFLSLFSQNTVNQYHPEYGKNTPLNSQSKNSTELIHKRTEYSRVFENEFGIKTTAKSSVPLHYKDHKDRWISIDYSISELADKKGTMVFPANKPQFFADSKTGEINYSEEINLSIGQNHRIIQLDANSELIDFPSDKNYKSNYYSKNNKLVINNLFEHINYEISFYHSLFKTNYIINNIDFISDEAEWIIIEFDVFTDESLSIEFEKSTNAVGIGYLRENLLVKDDNGDIRAVLNLPVFSDSHIDNLRNTGVGPFNRPKYIDGANDRAISTYQGYYNLSHHESGHHTVGIVIPAYWLMDQNRKFPVVIDPVVIIDNDDILETCFYPLFAQGDLIAEITEGDTIINTYLLWEFTATEGTQAWTEDQRSYVSGPNGSTAVFSGTGNSHGVQTYSLFSDIANTVSEGEVTISFHAARIWGPNYNDGECNAIYTFINRRYVEITHVDEIVYGPGNIVINEYSCSNRQIQDDFGNYEDWIELYNDSENFVDLTGHFLSDNPNNPYKWQFSSVFMNPGSHLIVVCSGRDAMSGLTPHTNFRLNQLQPESIIFSDPNGEIIESFTLFTTQFGHSYGRLTDGEDIWGVFTNPSPGEANLNGALGYSSKPTLSHQAGFYDESFLLTISHNDFESEIRYTTNGDAPTESSDLYTEPIEINETQVIRARVFADNPDILPGFIATKTFFIGEDHELPVVSVSGSQLLTLFNGTQIRPHGAFEYFDESGQYIDKAVGEFNKHGNDSWNYAQRGVDFIGRDEHGYNEELNHKLFMTSDRTKFKRYMIKAAANDNYPHQNGGAHVRDAYIQHLSQLGKFRMDERTTAFCAVYVNGQYWGLYDLREKVDDHDFCEYYYDQERQYKGSEEYIQFIKTWGASVPKYGEQRAIDDWNWLRGYVQGHFMGHPEDFAVVDETLDWRSLIDYFVYNSYIVSRDWINYNTGWWRGLNPQGSARAWRYILWDMDAAFGHFHNYTGIPDATANALPCNVENLSVAGDQGHVATLSKLIDENEDVRHYYITRYADLLNTTLSCDYMHHVLDSLVDLMMTEMPRQIDRWGGSMAGWETNLNTLRQFIDDRCIAVSEGLIPCYDLDGPYTCTFDVYPQDAGRIKMNTIWIPEFPFDASVYGNIETRLTATAANSSYIFSHWVVNGHEISPDEFSPDIILWLEDDDSITAYFSDANLHGKDLLYYWHFNNLDTSDGDVTSIDADYSYIPEADPKMIYTGSGARDIDEYNIGSIINTLLGNDAGKAARVRNPAAGRSLIFNMPSLDYGDLLFEYSVHRSANGMLNHAISYSIDGVNFTNDHLQTYLIPITEEYFLVEVDFSEVPGVDHNENFHIKIDFLGNTGLESGNNRFDNISLKGEFMPFAEIEKIPVESVFVYPNPFRDRICIDSEYYFDRVGIYSTNGKLLKSEKFRGRNYYEMDTSELPPGMYILIIYAEEGTYPIKIIKR